MKEKRIKDIKLLLLNSQYNNEEELSSEVLENINQRTKIEIKYEY